MTIVTHFARVLMGIMFLVFGLNGFLHFIPQGPPPEGAAAQFLGVLTVTHYFAFVFALQIAGGALLLVNRFVPLALCVIGPVIVNILLFHSLMEPHGIGPGCLALVFWVVVAISVRSALAGIFQMRVPRQAETTQRHAVPLRPIADSGPV